MSLTCLNALDGSCDVLPDALRLAASGGHVKVVALLLEDGRVDASANNNRAAVLAKENGHSDVVSLLLTNKGTHAHALVIMCETERGRERARARVCVCDVSWTFVVTHCVNGFLWQVWQQRFTSVATLQCRTCWWTRSRQMTAARKMSQSDMQ